MKINLILSFSIVFLLTACASHPDKIEAAYVSPEQYRDYDCDQVSQEMVRVNDRANSLYKKLKDERQADDAQMAVGLILFWPALFFLEGGDGPEAQEYARLKGERQVLEKAVIEKECNTSDIPKFADATKAMEEENEEDIEK